MWSVLYIRDVQLTLSGLSIVRRSAEEDWKPLDIIEVTEGDWEDNDEMA